MAGLINLQGGRWRKENELTVNNTMLLWRWMRIVYREERNIDDND
jgi:hypothetical protein